MGEDKLLLVKTTLELWKKERKNEASFIGRIFVLPVHSYKLLFASGFYEKVFHAVSEHSR